MRYEVFAFVIGGALMLSGCGQTSTVSAASEASMVASSDSQPKPVPDQTKPRMSSGVRRSSKVPPAEVAPAQPDAITLPAGTAVRVRSSVAISTKTAKPGDEYPATLDDPIAVGGTVVATKGSDATLRVVEAEKGGRVKGRASLTVKLASLRATNGRSIPVHTGPFTVTAKGGKKGDVAKIGILSGVGAAIGAIAGGGRGAAIGAASGGGAGAGYVVTTRGKAAVIAPESQLRFHLSAPVTVRATIAKR